MGNYKGASPEKVEARNFGYDQPSEDDMKTKYHITTGGACGDVPVLQRRGAPACHILVADIKEGPVKEAIKLGCQAWRCSIQDLVRMVLARYSRRLATVNVDLCETLQKGIPILNEVLKDLETSKWSGYVMYTCAWSFGGLGCNDRKRLILLNKIHRSNKEKIFTEEHIRRYSGTNGFPMAFIVMYVDNGHITPIKAME